jgi:hypothetical protein
MEVVGKDVGASVGPNVGSSVITVATTGTSVGVEVVGKDVGAKVGLDTGLAVGELIGAAVAIPAGFGTQFPKLTLLPKAPNAAHKLPYSHLLGPHNTGALADTNVAQASAVLLSGHSVDVGSSGSSGAS